MEARRGQFTLWHLLIELTLIAALLGAVRMTFLRWGEPHDVLPVFTSLAGLALVPVLCGAVIGGFFGSFRAGAAWGATALGALVALATLFVLVTGY